MPWRQFQRRQVTPSSSHQTTSPASGCSTTSSPPGHGGEALVAGGPDEAHPALDVVQVLTADRDQMGHADRVVDVDQGVDPRQSAVREGPLGQCLRRVAGARGLGAEGRVGGAPGRHVRVLVRGASVESCGETACGVVEKGRSPFTAGAVDQSVRLDGDVPELGREGPYLVGHGEVEGHRPPCSSGCACCFRVRRGGVPTGSGRSGASRRARRTAGCGTAKSTG